MCARWPTIAMSKIFFGFERSFCRCMAVMSCDLGWCVCDLTSFHQVMWLVVRWFVVLLRSYSVLQRPTTYYSSTTPTCYSVLQRTTPGLLCTTKYYSSTTLYYEVLLFTAKYYASTTLHYTVLLQYYSVLQSTTPVLLQYYKVPLCTTKYHASTTKYYASTTTYYSSTTLYYKVLRPVLQSTTPVLLCSTKYYGSVVRVASCHVMWCLGMSATTASAHSKK